MTPIPKSAEKKSECLNTFSCNCETKPCRHTKETEPTKSLQPACGHENCTRCPIVEISIPKEPVSPSEDEWEREWNEKYVEELYVESAEIQAESVEKYVRYAVVGERQRIITEILEYIEKVRKQHFSARVLSVISDLQSFLKSL